MTTATAPVPALPPEVPPVPAPAPAPGPPRPRRRRAGLPELSLGPVQIDVAPDAVRVTLSAALHGRRARALLAAAACALEEAWGRVRAELAAWAAADPACQQA